MQREHTITASKCCEWQPSKRIHPERSVSVCYAKVHIFLWCLSDFASLSSQFGVVICCWSEHSEFLKQFLILSADQLWHFLVFFGFFLSFVEFSSSCEWFSHPGPYLYLPAWAYALHAFRDMIQEQWGEVGLVFYVLKVLIMIPKW